MKNSNEKSSDNLVSSKSLSYVEMLLQGDIQEYITKFKYLIISLIAVSWSIFHIYTSYFGVLEAWRHRSVTLSFLLMLGFLCYPLKNKSLSNIKGIITHVVDAIMIILTIMLIGYTQVDYINIIYREGMPNTNDLIFGGITILLIVEITRRTVGYGMAVLSLAFLLYMLYGYYLPGPMGLPPISYVTVVDTMFNSTYGIFGLVLGVMSTIIMIFVIFGGFILYSKVGDFFIQLAYAVTGHYSGGPAKVSIFASGIMGMLSGAAAANVVTTGVFTIPLMKKVGYRAEFAGAVEAASSMGGQFLPPIMGAAAFIIAEQLRLPYIHLCLYALLPALLHFFAVFMMVHNRAKAKALPTMSKEELPNKIDLLKRYGHLLLPIIIIISALVAGYTPQRSGFWAIISVVALTSIRSSTRMNWHKLLSALEVGARNAIPIAAVCACAGIIVGTVTMTGLGLKISRLVLELSGGFTIIGLILIMCASIILGMGMTTVSAYVILAILAVPALVDMGIMPIAAHLFVFYFAIFSNVTPPVAISSYAAAGISGGNAFQTSIEGFKICLGTLLLPYMFTLGPGLLMHGSPYDIIHTLVTAVIGITCLAASLQGYMITNMSMILRIVCLFAALLLVFPYVYPGIIGIFMFILIVTIQHYIKKREVLDA